MASVWDTDYSKVQDETAPAPGTRTFQVKGPSQTEPFFKETTPAPPAAPGPAPLPRAPGGPLPRDLMVSHGSPVDPGTLRGSEGIIIPGGPDVDAENGVILPRPGVPLLTNRAGRMEIGRVPGERAPTGLDPAWAAANPMTPTSGPLPVSSYDPANPRKLQLRTGTATEVDPVANREMLRGILTSEGPANQSMVDRILGRVSSRRLSSGNDGSADSEWNQRMATEGAGPANIIGRNGRVSKSLVRLQEQRMQDASAGQRQESSNAAELERTLISKALDLEHAGRTDEAATLRALALEDRKDTREDKSLSSAEKIAGMRVGQQEDALDLRSRLDEERGTREEKRDERRAKREAQQRIAKDYEVVAAKAQEYGDPVPSREEYSRQHLLAEEAGYATAAAQGERKVVRTGTINGRKVVKYSDGSTEYAD